MNKTMDQYYTEEEIQLMLELLKECKRGISNRRLAQAWFVIYNDNHSHSKEAYPDEYECVKAVKTGIAKTKLFKALK